MAESKYALVLTTMNGGAGYNATGPASGQLVIDALARPLAELKLAVLTASQDIRLLIKEQVRLRDVMAALQSLAKFNLAAPAAVAASEPKSKLTAAIEQRPPRASMQPAMALQTAMARLKQVPGMSSDLKSMENANRELASEKSMAGSGATAVSLAEVEYAAGKSGVGANLTGDAKEKELLDFGRDAATNATAFGIELKAAGEMLAAWRTSLKLDRAQSQNLADATSHLGKHSLKATAADIGSVVQSSGEAGVAAGIAPEQLAALAASLLNADVDKATASASVKSISAALAKGRKGSAEERAAWATLGLQPDNLTDDVPQTLFRTLEALKKQPASQQAALLKTLFNGDEGVSKLLEKPQDVGQTFALLTAKKPLDPQTELLKKLSGGSEGLHQLMALPSADGKAFSPLPLQGPTQSLEPQYKGAVQRSADAAGGSVQQSPDAYEASKIRLTKAVAPNVQMPDWLTASMNLMADKAEANPKVATALALAAAGITSMVGALLAKAFDNFTGKLVKSAAARLPAGLGKWIADVDVTDIKPDTSPDTSKAPKDKRSTDKPGSTGTSGRRGGLRPRRVRIKSRIQGKDANRPLLSPGDFVAPRPVISAPGPWPGSMTAFAGSSSASSMRAAPLSGSYAKAGRLVAKKAPPLRLLSAGYEMVTGVMKGDTRSVVSSGASLAGASAGAAIGAAIGTLILPGVGTMVGGWLGSMAGAEIGASLGDRLGAQVDRLDSPAQVSKELTAVAATPAATVANQPVTLNSTIHINGQDQASAQTLANLVVQTTMSQLGQIMPTNPLATRRDAALTDGVA
ncbi:phage tail tape measure protein [Pseudomonas anatoliensis]|uniref:phage tail tape measure protein n=1 Tax=Pseudomonas anatoliensis TaxID=2710589 RepID=UPI001B32C94B|nr:phage tail tape measure protein [Pseudomonas anatoliensis]MBP5957268.1 phage tail tape measure protein [Pseudomonas anatoliensis]